jgi:hypothetical protein
MSESFDLNAELAKAYINWQQAYLTGMPQLPGESTIDYCDRMCCTAFMEGAKTLQTMTHQAIIEAVAEAFK